MHLLLLAASLLLPLAIAEEPLESDGTQEKPPPDEAVVIRVYDGDTVTIATGDPVRLRWVNTPELRPMEAFAEEARDLAADFVGGKLVQLSYAEPNRDGYGRLIADVIIDGVSLEEKLLEAGYAHIMLIPPLEDDLEVLFEAQARARESRAGIWGHDRYQGALHITSFHANGRGNDRADPNSEYLRVCNITDEPVNVAGYTITNIRRQVYTFPALVIPAGHTVKVHSGVGEHQTDPSEQLAIFLGSDAPLWNNTRDLATIFDASGQQVDRRLHEVKSR
jgi:micrococcal nuclease